ncbi:MAG: triose-phosphate isomerase family protein [Herbiconiux sp.]|nr:triose-phosphate isomerase family protein [Herbiconiux sp.]
MGERFWIGTSWKMNKTLTEAAHWVGTVLSRPAPRHVSTFVVPPFTALAHVARLAQGTDLLVGAQDVHAEPDGPHTGDVSAHLAADAGAVIAEIGHQERRAAHGETDELINRKVLQAVRSGLRPLLCVGDLASDRTRGTVDATIARQVTVGLHGIAADSRPLVAYEPAWSIGVDGTPATPGDIAHAHRVIRAALETRYGRATAADVPILYGGSVSRANCREIARVVEVDGLFIGRAALDPEEFLAIAHAAIAARHQGAS